MLTLRQPAIDRIRELLDQQSLLPLTYREEGGTEQLRLPTTYHTVEFSRKLGRGEQVFAAAVQAMSQWNSFRLPWARLVFDGKPETGNHLAIAFRALGIWSLNCCRVVAHDPCVSNPESWSFTLGTLPLHTLQGEEKISITLDAVSGDVNYRIRSFSRPQFRVSRIALPWIRHHQHRFCEESYRAMDRFVRAEQRFPAATAARNSSDPGLPTPVLMSRTFSQLQSSPDEQD